MRIYSVRDLEAALQDDAAESVFATGDDEAVVVNVLDQQTHDHQIVHDCTSCRRRFVPRRYETLCHVCFQA